MAFQVLKKLSASSVVKLWRPMTLQVALLPVNCGVKPTRWRVKNSTDLCRSLTGKLTCIRGAAGVSPCKGASVCLARLARVSNCKGTGAHGAVQGLSAAAGWE